MGAIQQRHAALTIAAQAGELRRAAGWLQACASAHGVPDADAARLDLSLHEALANIIDHGGLTPDAPVRLALEVGDGCATLTLSDGGKPFDPVTAPLPRRAATLEETLPGGLGLAMIRSQTDSLRYRYEGGCNTLALTVYWTGR